VEDDPNHPTDDEPFFSAFASNSSPLDGIVYGMRVTLEQYTVSGDASEVASGDPRRFGNTQIPLTKLRGGGSTDQVH